VKSLDARRRLVGVGTVYAQIDQKLRDWLLAQPAFFVATAPLSAAGHVNLSPKGMDGTFAVLGPHRVGYLDYYGSGAETIAHLRENGRIVIMCCAFAGPPKIVRLHGRGRALMPGDAEFAAARRAFGKPRDLGLRAIIVVEVDRVADSCGYSVPLMDFVSDRDILDRSHERRDPEYFEEYAATRNDVSIDGLPALAEHVQQAESATVMR
jgi:Pyridoxamine 5'-phosphate oxidase